MNRAEEYKQYMSKVDEEIQQFDDLQTKGYAPWNDHPGYTIGYLNEMLKEHNLRVITVEFEAIERIVFKIEKIHE